MAAPSASRIRTGASLIGGAARRAENEMPPSPVNRGSSVVLRSFQRHVFGPWRRETVKNCSVRSGATEIVSVP